MKKKSFKRFLERSIESPLVESTFAYGEAFEHFLILEFYRLNSYLEKDYRLSYFRSKEGQKIDLIISPNRKEEILIEIKATKRVDLDEVAKLQRLASNFNTKSVLYLSQDPNPQKIDQVLCLSWQKGLAHVFPELGNSLVGG